MLKFLTAFMLTASVAFAQTPLPTLANDGIEARLTALKSTGSKDQYEIAFLTALRALEKAAQAQQRDGIGASLQSNPIFGFAGRSARLASRRPAKPEALREITTQLLQDLTRARTELEAIENPASARFELNVNDIWFDLNQNNIRDETENANKVMAPILGRAAVRRAEQLQSETETDIVIQFDHADIAWLTAYTHMLSAVGEATLAFDPTPIIEKLQTGQAALRTAPTLPPFYDLTKVRENLAVLKAEQDQIKQERRKLSKEIDPLKKTVRAFKRSVRKEKDGAKVAILNAEIANLETKLDPLDAQTLRLMVRERTLRDEIRSAEAKLPGAQANGMLNDPRLSQFVDGVYVLLESLRQQPNAAHLNAAVKNWDAMIAQNQEFWNLVSQETDNTNEWVPNASQTSAIGIEITQETADTWQRILREANAVVDGQLLIPHPFLPKGVGISLKKYLENPAPLDLIGWLQGSSAYPYAVRGQRISDQTWRRLQRLSGGNATLFALFLN